MPSALFWVGHGDSKSRNAFSSRLLVRSVIGRPCLLASWYSTVTKCRLMTGE